MYETLPVLDELRLELASSFMLSQGSASPQNALFAIMGWHHQSRGRQHRRALKAAYGPLKVTPPLDLPAGHQNVSTPRQQEETKFQAENYCRNLKKGAKQTPKTIAHHIGLFVERSLALDLAYVANFENRRVGNDPHDSWLRKFFLLERTMPTPALSYFYDRTRELLPTVIEENDNMTRDKLATVTEHWQWHHPRQQFDPHNVLQQRP